MEDELKIDQDYKNGFNLGYELGKTAEGRKQVVELNKLAKVKTGLHKGVEAGVRQSLVDDLHQQMEQANLNRSRGR